MIAWLQKHNVVLWLVSLLVAVMLWAYVMVVQNPERESRMSIVPNFVGEESLLANHSLQITQGAKMPVSLRFLGRQTDLAKLDQSNVQVLVDLKNVYTAGSVKLAYEVVLPPEVADRITVERAEYYVTLQFDTVDSRYVPVRLKLEGAIAEGYVKLQEILQPESIRVTGPTTVLDSISYAQVVLERDNISKTIEAVPLTFTLMGTNGSRILDESLTFDLEEVLVTIPIEMTKDVPLKMDFIDGGGLFADKNITYQINPASITLAGNPEVLNTINSIKLTTMDLAKLFSSVEEELPIVLPDNTRNLSGVEKAVVTVDIHGVTTMPMTVSTIEIAGQVPPAGYEVELVTTQMTITLRGPPETLELIQPHMLRVSVDLTDVGLVPGTLTVAAKVSVDGYSNVGAVGDYSAVVVVQEITDEQEE